MRFNNGYLYQADQKEFDEFLAKKCQSKIISGMDLRRVSFKGRDIDGVDFTHCHIGDMALMTKEQVRRTPSFTHCTIRNIENEGEGQINLFLRDCLIGGVVLRGLADSKISAISTNIDGINAAGCTLRLSATNGTLKHLELKDCKGEAYLSSLRLYDLRLRGETRLSEFFFENISTLGHIHMMPWSVHFTGDLLKIGCQVHPIEVWKRISDYDINLMAVGALEWWKEMRETVFAIVDNMAHSLPKVLPYIDLKPQPMYSKYYAV